MNALIKKGMLMTVLALSVNTAMAAQSIDIKVTGKIIPSSCTPAFPSGGGIADFGTMKVASLNATSVTPLTERKEIPVSITCEEDTRVAVKFTDAREASSPTADIPFYSFSGSPQFAFGLGTYNSKNIGAYALGISLTQGANTNGNGESLYPMFSLDSGETWGRSGSSSHLQIASDNREIYGFTKDLSTGVLSAESKINFKVFVEATINPTNDLNVTDEVTLDGLTNVELVYL